MISDPLAPALDLTTRSQEAVLEQNQPKPPQDEAQEKKKKLHDEFRSRIDACKSYRRRLVSTWTANIDMRRGKAAASQGDEERTQVPIDWSLTKTKQASLFSQVPQLKISHPFLGQAPFIFTLEQKTNDLLRSGGIESAMDEVLPDVINASGIGGVIVAYEAITRDKEMPVQDPATLPPGAIPEMKIVPEILDKRYTVQRISPSDLLWPINFTGSDFNNAAWIGRSGRVSWATAVQRWKLTEEDKERCLGEDRQTVDRLTHDVEKERTAGDELVSFDEIFYRVADYHEDATSYSAIHTLVFVAGKPEPVVDEPWKGQQLSPEGVLLGSKLPPIQLLTLSYISDETIPPSDTAVGRPMVLELNKLRQQVIIHRDRNIPVRWFDVNRIDPTVQHSLMRGTWAAMIPVQGNGGNVLGEIAKSTMPQENFTFDSLIKGDLSEAWSIGPNQMGSGAGVETKGEGDQINEHFQTRLGRERAKVGKFFCNIAEILASLVCLYEDPAELGEGFDPAVSKSLCFSILADSTVLLDSNQRLERLINFVNFGAKSGWVNIEPVMKEIAQLSGLDPNQVITPPQPEPPTKPNMSVRISGAEDLLNPLMLAFLVNSGQAPSPEQIEQAKQLISMVVVPAPPPPPPMLETGPDGSTKVVPSQPSADAQTPVLQGMQITLQPAQDPNQMGQQMVGPDGMPVGPDGMPIDPSQMPPPAPEPGMAPPPPPPPQVGEANPKWGLMPHVSQRAEDGGEVQ